LSAYPTLAPLFRAVKRTDVQTLTLILGEIRIIKPITNPIFAYELVYSRREGEGQIK
jgi:hypothetical protein